MVPGPPFEICAPAFHVGSLVAAYTQYSIFNMCTPFWFLAPLFGFWPPLLLNPDDGPWPRVGKPCCMSFSSCVADCIRKNVKAN